jgi:K+-sensing histidine kinase KdpD
MKDELEQRLWNAHFVAMISHELRTPLTTIISFSQTLSDESELISKQEQFHYLELIEKEGKRIAHYINELTEIMKLETGSTFNRSEFTLDNSLKNLINNSDLHLNNPVNLQLSPELCQIQADRSLIETAISILLNYLDNKCKGPLSLQLEQKAGIIQGMLTGKDGNFTEREIHQLFDINAQLTISRSGIPLNTRPIFAAAVIRGHNGNIWISSIPENGALISFELQCNK